MRILIVDDEAPARSRLRRLLEEFPEHEVVGEAEDGRSALDRIQHLHPDIVLMDIRMPVMDGLEVARHLGSLPHPPATVFCTAYGDHALAAFETNAVDYLMKPIRRERLRRALEKANRVSGTKLDTLARGRQRRHICARVRGNLELIPLEAVIYFLAEYKYVTVCHDSGEVLIEDSLKSLEDEFADRFVRIHRNALVARDRLAALEKGSNEGFVVKLRGSEKDLEVSRRNLPAVRHLITHL